MVDPTTTVIAAVAAKSFTSLVSPIVNSAFKGLKSVSEYAIETFSNQFENYVNRQILKHSYLNTLVFQNQIILEDLYIPLTIETIAKSSDSVKIKISKFHDDFIPKNKKIILTDTAGMGKSTLLKFLLIQCVKSNFAIPIFIELRHLSSTQTISSLIERELNLDKPDDAPIFNLAKINRLLKKGGIVFFFDGYDEISFKDREAVTKDIKNFTETYPDNFYTITSRPESGLSAFPSFIQFRITPLKKEESFSLIRKYDSDGDRSKQLIERLKGKDLNSVHDFLKNPLLTTLLYRCFEYKQNVPTKKHIFYRQVFDALYDWHDSSKDGYNTREKKSKLDLDSFHRVLRAVGFISTINGEIEGDKDRVLSWIRDAKQVCVGLSFSESDFLEDLICAVPVFAKDGLYFKWSHKSLAEYFAAQYICTEGKAEQEEVFGHIMNSDSLENFSNMLDQVYDIDTAGFRKYFSYPMAKAFTEYRANSFKGIDPFVSNESIELRKSLTFLATYIIFSNKKLTETKLHTELKKALGKNEIEGVSINLGVINSPPERNKQSLMVMDISSKYHIIANILNEKKDSLVLSYSKITSYSGKFNIVGWGRNSMISITDESFNILNSIKNFEVTNHIIINARHPVILDGDACKSFCDNFSDEDKKTNFTKKILIASLGIVGNNK